jgi:hypothetical protein
LVKPLFREVSANAARTSRHFAPVLEETAKATAPKLKRPFDFSKGLAFQRIRMVGVTRIELVTPTMST